MSTIFLSGIKMADANAKSMVTKAGGQPIHTNIVDAFTMSLVGVVDTLNTALNAIHRNGNLSGEGKADAAIPYFVKSWNALDDLAKSALDERDMVIADLENQIQPKPFSSGNPIIDELRAAEIRRDLKGSLADVSGRLKVRQAYLKACEDGSNPLFCHACETAPATVIIGPDDIVRGKMARAKAENPQKVKDLEIFKVMRTAMDYPLMYAKKILKDLNMPVVCLDWGRVALEQIGNSKIIRLVSMRPYVMRDIVKKNITTPDAAKKAGYQSQPWDDGQAILR